MKSMTLAVLLLAAGLLIACDDDEEPGSIEGQVALEVEVIDEDGQSTGAFESRPVENAAVALLASGEAVRQTSSDGEGHFELSNIAPDSYELEISGAGGATNTSISVQVRDGAQEELNSPVTLGPDPQGFLVYPTPATSRMVLSFTMAEASAAEVLALDGGGPVRTLFNGPLSEGVHEFMWDFTDDVGNALNGRAFWLVVDRDGEESIAAVLHDPPGALPTECKDLIDQHWSEEAWEGALVAGELEEFFGYGVGSTSDDVQLYVSRDEDPEGWYENTLRWDVFSWGWREYWDDEWPWPSETELYVPGLSTPFDPDNIFLTPLRQEALDCQADQ
jgi:hypothetical protein